MRLGIAKKLFVAAFLFGSPSFLVSCKKKDVPAVSNKRIVFQAGQLGQKPWDPKASYSVQINFNAAVFTNPVKIEPDYSIKPGLIKDWKWNNKTNSFLFTIDNDLKFSSDRYLNPIDLEFAILKNFITTGDLKRSYFYDIKGIEKLKPGQKFKSGMCEGVQIVGKNQIEVFLNKQNPNFIYTLQDGIPPVAPIEDFDSDLFSFKGIPRGTGEFFVELNDPESSTVTLRRKGSNISNSPNEIVFLNGGVPLKNNVDLAVDAGGEGLKEDQRYKIQYGRIPKSIHVISFNFENHLSNDLLFRKSISLALDRAAIFKEYLQTAPNHELIPSIYLGRSGTKFDYNPEEAKILVKKLRGKFKVFPKVLAIYHGDPTSKDIPPYITEIKRQLDFIGLPVEFAPTESVRFDSNKHIAFRVVGKGTLFTDPLSSFTPFIYNSKDNAEYAMKSDKESLEYYDRAKSEVDKDAQAKALKQLTLHFQQNYLAIPLGETRTTYILGPRIEEIDINNRFSSVDFTKVILNEK